MFRTVQLFCTQSCMCIVESGTLDLLSEECYGFCSIRFTYKFCCWFSTSYICATYFEPPNPVVQNICDKNTLGGIMFYKHLLFYVACKWCLECKCVDSGYCDEAYLQNPQKLGPYENNYVKEYSNIPLGSLGFLHAVLL